MPTTSPEPSVPMRRGRRIDRVLHARLRAERPLPFRHREKPAIDAGLAIVRVAVGVTFLAHGVDKLVDLTAATAFFDSLGLPLPGWLAPLVAGLEVVGGLALILGFATPLAGVALAGDMVVAYLTAHLGHGFFVSEGGGELVLLLAATSAALVCTGAGRYSVDGALRVRCLDRAR